MSQFKHDIILFDGICNFCNGTVNYIISKDKLDKFRFTSLQSDTGKELVKEYQLEKIDSIVFISAGKLYVKSTAVIKIAQKIGGTFSLLSILLIIPAFLRNLVYDLIAKNRYKWFGVQDVCRIPTEKEKSKFL